MGFLRKRFVKFRHGFIVDPSYTLSLDIVDPVSGVVNLGRQNTTVGATGAIALDSSVTFGPDVSLVQGGIVYGEGNTISFDGDFELPARKRLRILSDTVLDGRGNNFIFGQDAQIMIDHGVTVTLKNMTISNVSNAYFKQIVEPVGSTAGVALDNVIFDLQDDVYFKNGKLYVHGDVLVSGEHTFMYRSGATSYIVKNALLLFDCGSTFNYNPTTTSDSLIHMVDGSSCMAFDGAKLESFGTPLRLTNGRLYLDNSVTISSPIVMPSYGVAQNLGSSIILTGGGATEAVEAQVADQDVNAIAWTADGNYLAVGMSADYGSELRVYYCNAGALELVNDVSKNFPGKQGVLSLDWRDNQYLAVGLENDFDDRAELRIYSFDSTAGAQTLTEIGVNQNIGCDVTSVCWRSDGKYLAVGANNTTGVTSELRVYEFDTALTLTHKAAVSFLSGQQVTSVDWRTTGVITVGCTTGTLYEVLSYDFNGDTLTQLTLQVELGRDVTALDWEVTSTYLAVGIRDDNSSGSELCVYRYSMTSPDFLKPLALACTDTGQTVKSVHWSPDSKYLAVGFENASASGADEVRVYGFASETLSFLPHAVLNFTGQDCNFVRWNHDGAYLAVGLNYGSEQGVRVYSFDGTTLSLTDSEIARGEILGGSRYHSGYDLEIQTVIPLLNKYNSGQTYLTDLVSISEDTVNTVAWTPDGNYLAVGMNDDADVGHELSVYRFDDETGSESLTVLSSLGVSTGQTVNSASWSSDGLHLAVGMNSDAGTGNEIRVYLFDNTFGSESLSEVAGALVNTNQNVKSVSWSSDGAYLAAGLSTDGGVNSEIRVYSFNGTTLSELTVGKNIGQNVNSICWSPDGAYLAAGLASDAGAQNEIRVYAFDGVLLTELAVGKNLGQDVLSVCWSPDGLYLAAGLSSDGGGESELRVYKFYRRRLAELGVGQNLGKAVTSVAFSCDGAYISVGLSSGSGNEIRVFKFDGDTLTEATEAAQELSQDVNTIVFSPDGGYFAAGLSQGDDNEIRVYSFGDKDYTWTDTAVIFGDSSQVDSDLSVYVLGGAHVEIDGVIADDSSFDTP